jgi:hypothetical protein
MASTRRRFRPRIESLESRNVPTATFTTLVSSADPAAYGQTYSLTATVFGGDYKPGTGIVQDYVSFYADGSAIPFITVPVVNGVAVCTVSNPTPGLHSIVASYSGGDEFVGGSLQYNASSTSLPLLQYVGLPPVVPVPQVPAGHAAPHPHGHHHGHHHHR